MRTIKINQRENEDIFNAVNKIMRDIVNESNDVYYINREDGCYTITNQATRTTVKLEAKKYFSRAIRLIREEFERQGLAEEETVIPADKDEVEQPKQQPTTQPDFHALWEEAQTFTHEYDGRTRNNVYLVNKVNMQATSAAEVAFTMPEWNSVLTVLASVACPTCALTKEQAEGIVMVKQAEFYGGSLMRQSESACSMMRIISDIYNTYFIVLENIAR